MDANGLEQNVVLSQLKQCRSHMLTQRKRRQKNRLICIQLRLLRTRFEIKDTWIENDFDLFFWGGGGGEEVRWKTVRTYGKILATPLFWRLNTLKGTAKAPTVDLSRMNNLRQTIRKVMEGGNKTKKVMQGRVTEKKNRTKKWRKNVLQS